MQNKLCDTLLLLKSRLATLSAAPVPLLHYSTVGQKTEITNFEVQCRHPRVRVPQGWNRWKPLLNDWLVNLRVLFDWTGSEWKQVPTDSHFCGCGFLIFRSADLINNKQLCGFSADLPVIVFDVSHYSHFKLSFIFKK